MSYSVRRVDLSTAVDDVEIVPPGADVDGVFVARLPQNADVWVRIGQNAPFPLPGTCFIGLDAYDDESTRRQGVYVSVVTPTVGQSGYFVATRGNVVRFDTDLVAQLSQLVGTLQRLNKHFLSAAR